MTYSEFMRRFCKGWDGASTPTRVFRTVGVIDTRGHMDAIRKKADIRVNESALAKPGAMLQVICCQAPESPVVGANQGMDTVRQD